MKQRLDLLLVERGLAPSRTIAQALIMAGKVRSGEVVMSKSGQQVNTDIDLQVAQGPPYVSRGGEKLASVAEDLKLDFHNKVVLDVGSSTGGFTDYVLQHGASKVYAVDVGNAQLAYKLREDERVVAMERTDIRDVVIASEARQSSELDRHGHSLAMTLPELADIAVADVSFISLTKILTHISCLLSPSGLIVAMAKPQFETDKATADRFRGVINDEAVRVQILEQFESAVGRDFEILVSKDSGVTGAQGNRERFYVLRPKR